ncbi:MAG: co-chaperone GroES [Planctomycetaceae bacterium]|nr:co-chaperone GroES [Planctomycetaceae bacterium]
MTLKLLSNLVAIERCDPNKLSTGGILLPNQKRPDKGTVVAVGPGKPIGDAPARSPMAVKPGHTVYFSSYSGIPVEHQGQELLLMPETEILAIESEGDPDEKTMASD